MVNVKKAIAGLSAGTSALVDLGRVSTTGVVVSPDAINEARGAAIAAVDTLASALQPRAGVQQVLDAQDSLRRAVSEVLGVPTLRDEAKVGINEALRRVEYLCDVRTAAGLQPREGSGSSALNALVNAVRNLPEAAAHAGSRVIASVEQLRAVLVPSSPDLDSVADEPVATPAFRA